MSCVLLFAYITNSLCLEEVRFKQYDIIRIYHEFVDMIDDSVQRIIAWHHKARPTDAKQRPDVQMGLSYPKTHVDFLSHTLGARAFINPVF